jgi:hypothetical protein
MAGQQQSESQTADDPGKIKPVAPVGHPAGSADMLPGDDAPPGTPGTGEDVDPKTGETVNQGVGGG